MASDWEPYITSLHEIFDLANYFISNINHCFYIWNVYLVNHRKEASKAIMTGGSFILILIEFCAGIYQSMCNSKYKF